MTWWQAAILGLVEGITEFLPISSTGHLILVSSLLGLDRPETREATSAFEIVIQGGAILAVLGLYAPRVLSMLRGLLGRDREGLRLLGLLVLGFLPAGLLGPLLDDWIDAHLFHPTPVLAALVLGGVWMLWLQRRIPRLVIQGEHLEAISARHALMIGALQCVAMWPGTSRSMMTIAGGLVVGMRPRDAAEFSFLLGLPTLGGACVFKLLKNLKHAHDTATPNLFEQLGPAAVAIGIVTATVSAALAVSWLVGFLNRRGLAAFGWYRIALGAVLGALLALGVVTLGA
ncbi:MAG TPA: undecaprenyl-diphosphate phosphatase [Myxococcota bacterium]|nr:undecaprenyl-diphosphate phosphatase [Myxococcota bacterium]